MASEIDVTKPVYGNPTTQSVRDNFAVASDEITDLQTKTNGAPFLPITGGTMNGMITLQSDPLNPYEVATKHYVDNMASVGGGASPSTVPPLMDGVAAVGSSLLYARQDHIHPSDTSRLALAGGTLTGPLTMAANAAASLQPVTLQQMTAALGGATGGATIGDAAPSSPNPGALWWDSVGGQLYVRFQDADSSQWVVANSAGIGDAPSDGVTYARKNAAWNSVDALVAPANNNVGRNLLHNGQFEIAQRGNGPWTTTGSYTADRWKMGFTGGSNSVTLNAVSDTERGQIGDEAAKTKLVNTFTGGAVAGNYMQFVQPIENVRRLAGKAIIVSFWASCTTGTLKIGVSFTQVFGTGGSPSASVNGNGIAVTIDTTFRRYSVTLSLPSMLGKTLGTNGDDYTQLELWCSSEATYNARSGSIGVQSGTINLWGVQLEIGSVATPLAKRDPQQELALCQRFYEIGTARDYGYSSIGGTVGYTYQFKVTKRAVPTVILTNAYSSFTGTTSTVDSALTDMFSAYRTATSQSPTNFMDTFTASADL